MTVKVNSRAWMSALYPGIRSLLPLSVLAAGSACADSARWIPLGATELAKVHLDKLSLSRTGSKARAVVKWVYVVPQETRLSGPATTFTISTQEMGFDCGSMSAAILSFKRFADEREMRQVSAISWPDEEARYRRVNPATVVGAALDHACSVPIAGEPAPAAPVLPAAFPWSFAGFAFGDKIDAAVARLGEPQRLDGPEPGKGSSSVAIWRGPTHGRLMIWFHQQTRLIASISVSHAAMVELLRQRGVTDTSLDLMGKRKDLVVAAMRSPAKEVIGMVHEWEFRDGTRRAFVALDLPSIASVITCTNIFVQWQ